MTEEANRAFAERSLRAHRLDYPDDQVVRLLHRHALGLAERGGVAVDLGCGSGRHVRLLHELGFRARGVDYSRDVIQQCKETFRGSALEEAFECLELRDWAARAEPTDLVLAWGALFLRNQSQMLDDLRLVRAPLSQEGLVLANFRTDQNWFCGLGEELGPGTFVLDERAEEYAGATYTFLDEGGVRALAQGAGYQVVSLEREDYFKGAAMLQHSWWLVVLAPEEGRV